MAKEIINRVANSQLMTIDLEDLYPEGDRVFFDIKDWLYQGLILREKDFRQQVKDHNWSAYQNSFVAIGCSIEVIIPAWAFMLISLNLEPYAKHVVVGDLNALEISIYQTLIRDFNVEPFKDKPVIIKGCSNKPVPENAYVMLSNKLKPLVRSIMYGEACSSVPLYKRK
jgi:hypothetical protein